MAKNESRLWTAQQAMAYLGLSGRTFWRLVWKEFDLGNLTPRRYGPQAFRFLPAEIEALEAKYTIRDRDDIKRLADARRTKVPIRQRPGTLMEARA